MLKTKLFTVILIICILSFSDALQLLSVTSSLVCLREENEALKKQLARFILQNQSIDHMPVKQVAENPKSSESSGSSAAPHPFSVQSVVQSELKGIFHYYAGFDHRRFLHLFHFFMVVFFMITVYDHCLKIAS